MNEIMNPILWSKTRQRPHPPINDFAHQNNFIDESIPIEDKAVSGLDRNKGLGYYQLSSEVKLVNNGNLVVPVSYDNGHVTNINLKGMNDEIFKPGTYLENAIKQMFYFGTGNDAWSFEFLDHTKLYANSRYVHPDIFKERYVKKRHWNDKVVDTPPCLWSELERVSLLFKYKQQTGDNIDAFISTGIDAQAVEASKLDKVAGECDHLPLLWSAFNVRSPNSLSKLIRVFGSDERDNDIDIYLYAYYLIQSRYLVHLANYEPDNDKFNVLPDWRDRFTKEELQGPPFFIIVPSTGDIFVFMKLHGCVMSLYSDASALSLGIKVATALREMSRNHSSQEPAPGVKIRGLVSLDTRERFEFADTYASTALALEILLHNLVTLANPPLDVDHLRVLVTEMMENCVRLPDLQKQYRARCWWAITRGELGHETDAMKNFNEVRGFVNVLRSAWDYTARREISEEYSDYGNINQSRLMGILNNFYETDVVTFSSNNYVLKGDIVHLIEAPLSDKGMNNFLANVRIDAMNITYSDNGGPRLYKQIELDYMMTNVKGKTERMKLTQRLFRGNPVFFHLIYSVSPVAMQTNNLVSGHACLCKVYLQNPSNGHDRKQKRYLVVEWLEGVFDNLYKLCAVPTLTYLSNFFEVQVKQREYDATKVLQILDGKDPCQPASLYAANERMKSLFKTNNQKDWKPYKLTLEEGRGYVTELAYSLLLMRPTPKKANRRDHEKINATSKQN